MQKWERNGPRTVRLCERKDKELNGDYYYQTHLMINGIKCLAKYATYSNLDEAKVYFSNTIFFGICIAFS